MKIKKHLLLFLTLSTTFIFANEPLEVCTDNSDWAPYTYYERVLDGKKINRFVGASVDALEAISKKTGIKFNISAYPWKRCLKSVEVFAKAKKYEAFMDGTQSPDRDAKFLRTDVFYSTTLGLFYSKDRFPNGLNVTKREELKPYKVCGIFGQNYDIYAKLGIKVDTGSKNASSAIKKVLGGRCEVYVNSLEPILGDVLLGNVDMPEKLKYTQIKEIENNYFYFWISRQSPRAEQLINTMNKAIRELKQEG